MPHESFLYDSSFRKQLESITVEQRRIALAAVDHAGDGETVAPTAGATTVEVIRSRSHPTLLEPKLATEAVSIAMEFRHEGHPEPYLAGGYLRGDWFSPADGDALRTVAQCSVDTA